MLNFEDRILLSSIVYNALPKISDTEIEGKVYDSNITPLLPCPRSSLKIITLYPKYGCLIGDKH